MTDQERAKLKEETTAKRLQMEALKKERDEAEKKELSSTLSTRSTLSNEAKDALSVTQLRSLVDNTSNQRLTKDLTPDQLSGKESIVAPETTLKPDMSGALSTPKTVSTPTTADSIRNQLVDTATNAAVNKFKNAYNSTKAELESAQSEASLGYAAERGKINVADAMARKASENRQATLGLSGSGSASQSDISQNVITSEATSASRANESAFKRDIQNQLSNAMNLRDQGIATAQSDAEITKLQNQLAAIERVEAQKVADEAAAKATYLDTIGQYSSNYQDQINQILNDGDPTNDWQVDYLAAARQNKISSQGLDPLTGKPIAEAEGLVSTEAQEALNAYNAGFRTQQVIDILTNAGYQFPIMSSGGYSGGGGGAVESLTPNLTSPVDTVKGFNVAGSGQGVGGLIGTDPKTASKDYIQLSDMLFNPENSIFGGDPEKVIDYILSDNFYNVYYDRIGEDGINQLLEQAYGIMESEANAAANIEVQDPIDALQLELDQMPKADVIKYLIENNNVALGIPYADYVKLLKLYDIEM